MEEYDKAIADFDSAIRLDPNEFDFYYNRGLARFNKADFPGAIVDFTEAIRIDPKSADSCFERAIAESKRNEFDKAISDYTEVIRLDPEMPSPTATEALHGPKRGSTTRRSPILTKPSASIPTRAISIEIEEMPEQTREQIREAIADFSEAIKLDPKNVVLLHCDERVYGRKRRISTQPSPTVTKPSGSNRRIQLLSLRRAAVWATKGDFEKAMDDCNAAIRLDLNNPEAFSESGPVCGSQGEL